jgi:hypothetical protein
MKNKSKVHEIFKKFATRSQNEFDVKIKRVRSDNGTEFKNTNIEEYLDEERIGHKLSVPYKDGNGHDARGYLVPTPAPAT